MSFKEEDETFRSNILRIDARFVNLIKWLGENHINVLLSGENRADGYAVYKIRENAFHGGTKFPQRMDFAVCDGAPFIEQCTGSRRMRTKS